MRSGRTLLALSIVTRLGVLCLLCFLALMTEYLNLKVAYNNPRLVELSSGKTIRVFYETTDRVMGWFGDPLTVAQRNGGMTWSVRVMGIPFTDPVAALSVLVRRHRMEAGFMLGLIAPMGLALMFGRVFCAYVCPASLLFFAIARIRRLLSRWFLFPEVRVNRGLAWGILIGGLLLAAWLGHGAWSLLLPYLAIGQTLFHGIAMGTLSVTLGSVVVFAVLDLALGRQFTCRHLCPTGRLLGAVGRHSLFALRRDAPNCLEGCHSCAEVCPLQVDPKMDQTRDCSMCGECLVICPTQCLSIGLRTQTLSPPGTPPSTFDVQTSNEQLEEHRGETVSRSPRGRAGVRGFLPRWFPNHPAGAPRALLLALLCLHCGTTPLHAHHFKGLPHYNYFENYPQVPEEEFLGQVADYEVSLVVYDFQGIQRADVPDPDKVRLYLVIFNLRDNRVYQGPLTLEILDDGHPVHSARQERAEQENLYALHRSLPNTGRYALRITLHDKGDLACTIPFRLSSQRIHWGKWVGGALLVLILIAAMGARKARIQRDRREARQRRQAKEMAPHA